MTMIEKVAEALFMEASKDRFGKWSTITEEARLLWRKSARAAIEATRDIDNKLMYILRDDGYDAMIDAALKED